MQNGSSHVFLASRFVAKIKENVDKGSNTAWHIVGAQYMGAVIFDTMGFLSVGARPQRVMLAKNLSALGPSPNVLQ